MLGSDSFIEMQKAHDIWLRGKKRKAFPSTGIMHAQKSEQRPVARPAKAVLCMWLKQRMSTGICENKYAK